MLLESAHCTVCLAYSQNGIKHLSDMHTYMRAFKCVSVCFLGFKLQPTGAKEIIVSSRIHTINHDLENL